MTLTPRFRACLHGAAAGVLAVALASPALATVTESRICRTTIGNQAGALVRNGFRLADACHRNKNKDCTPASSGGSDREDCLVSTSAAFDPMHSFLFKKTDAETRIDAKCKPGDPVAANYTGGDVAGEVIGAIEDDVEGSSSAIQGVADLECDDAKTACLAAIGKARSDIIKTVIRESIRCQKGVDRNATTFGPLEPSCLVGTPSANVLSRAAALIGRKCAGLTGADVGSCDPLPGCVTGAAISTAQSLAKATYASEAVTTQVCGNGATEGTEQCDDGNTTSGDGCSATCETEGDTCDGSYAGIGAVDGTRRVTVVLNTPSTLGGVEIGIDYPQFQTGIPGVGNSGVVNSRLTMLQSAGLSGMSDTGNDVKLVLVNVPGGFTSGNLAQIDFDNCASASTRLCNRTQNIMNCCNDVNDTTQFKRCENGTTPCSTNVDCIGIGAGICGPTRCTDGTTPCTQDSQCSLGQLCEKSPLVICDGNPPACTDQPAGSTLGVCNNTSHVPNGGCPGDNSCVSQSAIMGCQVSNPSDVNGQPVEGVSCTLSVVELP